MSVDWQNQKTSDAIAALRLTLEFSNAGEEAYGGRLIQMLKEAGRTGDVEDISAIDGMFRM